LHPTTGRVEVAGFVPWTGGPAFKRRIALVLGNRQQLVWDLPPEETFQLNRAIYDVPEADYRERLAELVALLQLSEVLEKPVRQLSLGERMKCELAAALLHRPPILFLDEPTLGLDVTAQEAIRGFLAAYRERHGATVLLTSHYMQDVTALASRVLIINRGRLLYDGGLDALVARIARTKRIELVLGDGAALRRADPQCLARGPAVSRNHHPVAVVGCDRACRRARHLVDDRGGRAGRRIRPGRLRALLLRPHAREPAHHRVGLLVPGQLDPRGRAELPARAPAASGARGGRREHRLQGAHRRDDSRGLAARGAGVARRAAAAPAGAVGAHRPRGAARRGDALLHQFYDGAPGLLDH